MHLTAKFLVLWLLQAFSPLFWKDPWCLGVTGALSTYDLRLGSITLHFEWPWFSGMVSICRKERFLWWKLHFSMSVRSFVENAVMDYTGWTVVVVLRDFTNPGQWARVLVPEWIPSCWVGLKSNQRTVGFHQGTCAASAPLGLLCHASHVIHR